MVGENVIHFDQAIANLSALEQPFIRSQGEKGFKINIKMGDGAIIPFEITNPLPHKNICCTIAATDPQKVEVMMTERMIVLKPRQLGKVTVKISPYYEGLRQANQDSSNFLFLLLSIL